VPVCSFTKNFTYEDKQANKKNKARETLCLLTVRRENLKFQRTGLFWKSSDSFSQKPGKHINFSELSKSKMAPPIFLKFCLLRGSQKKTSDQV
jgi:hypothetical protein